MKTIIFLIAILILGSFISCKNNQEQTIVNSTSNAFLYDQACVKYEVNWNEKTQQKAEGIDAEKFFDQLINDALTNKLKCKEFVLAGSKNELTFSTIDSNIKTLNLHEIKQALGEVSDTISKTTSREINKKELTSILFNECWNFDEKTFKMTKTINSYSPIRQYESPMVKGQMLKSLTFSVNSKNANKDLSLGKNIKYSVNLTNSPEFLMNGELNAYSPFGVEGLNKGRFMWTLINSVLSGKKKAFDFFATEKKQLSIAEIKKALGEKTDSITGTDGKIIIDNTPMNRYELSGIYFIENWYFDKSTFGITKEVVGMGPIREYTVGEAKLKSVPFIIYLNE